MSYQEKTGPLMANTHPGSYSGQDAYNDMFITEKGENMVNKEHTDNVDSGYMARRLTPTECAKLQGFPSDWAADVEHSDSAEYKMWGNGIALPCIIPMMKEMSKAIIEEMKLEQEDE